LADKTTEENVNNQRTYPCPSCSNYGVSDIFVAKENSTKFPPDIRSCVIHSKCDLLQHVFIFILNIKESIFYQNTMNICIRHSGLDVKFYGVPFLCIASSETPYFPRQMAHPPRYDEPRAAQTLQFNRHVKKEKILKNNDVLCHKYQQLSLSISLH
jgi:hypothetical protein